MIDFIKAEILNTNIENFINNPLLDFSYRVNNKTGAVDHSELSATYNGLSFVIRHNRRLFVSGSLPKYFLGNNYQNMTLLLYGRLLEKLKSNFGINASDVVLQNIELSICLSTGEIDPMQFLKSEVLDYKCTPKEIRVHRNTGYTINFTLKNYTLKLYDKGKQSKLSKNKLKFELRVKKMVHVKKIPLVNLEDLKKPEIWAKIQHLLLSTFYKIVICRQIDISQFNDIEQKIYLQGRTQNFWLSNKNKACNKDKETLIKNRNEWVKQRDEFLTLIDKYELDDTKNELIHNMWIELVTLYD